MLCRHRKHLHPEPREIVRLVVILRPIALVGGDYGGATGLAHPLQHLLVKRGDAAPHIDNNHAKIRIADRKRRLRTRLLRKGILRTWGPVERDAAGVNKHEPLAEHRHFTGYAIPRDARLVEHDGDALTRNAVEECRLADIWPTNY